MTILRVVCIAWDDPAGHCAQPQPGRSCGSLCTASTILRARHCAQASTTLVYLPRPGLAEAEGGVGDVGLFKGGDLFGGEFDREGGYGVGEVVGFGGSDDGRGDGGFREHPG